MRYACIINVWGYTVIFPYVFTKIRINNDLEIHRQVKTSDIISRRFGDIMTPLSRVQMRIK